MSTNKTTNYNLHAWLPQDEFHLTEINENFALLDAALRAEAGNREALSSALGERVRMVTGSYTGQSSAASVQVELGFRPKAVVILNTYRGISFADLSFLAIEGPAEGSAVLLTDTGFAAANSDNNHAYLNAAKTVYHYAAFY